MNLQRLFKKFTGGTAAPRTHVPESVRQAQPVLSRLHLDADRRDAVGYSYSLAAMFDQLPRSPLRTGHRVTWFDLGSPGTMPEWRAAIGIAGAHAQGVLDLHVLRRGTGTPIGSTYDPLSTANVFTGEPLSYLDACGLPDMAIFDYSFVRILRDDTRAQELVSMLVDDGVRLGGVIAAPEHRESFHAALIEAAGGPDKLDVRARSVLFWEAQPYRRLRAMRAV